ncbi:MAG: hypothetical protein COY19_09860, partial [Candidatus Marinimicrobia bacterium CG_4_10_14_0_2_um_filter_48_9]
MKRIILTMILLGSIGWSQTFTVPCAVLKGIPFNIEWEGYSPQSSEIIQIYGVEGAPVTITPGAETVSVRKLDHAPIVIKSEQRVFTETTPSVIPG